MTAPRWRCAPVGLAVLVITALSGPLAHADDLPQEVAAFDNTKITRSCRLILPPRPLVDEDANGVIHIEGNDITVDLEGRTLCGAEPGTARELLTGTGIRIRGNGVRVRNGAITGFKVGIDAAQCDGLVVEHLGFAGNFAQRLASTPEAEVASDWLWPQENGKDEWASKYGAAISVRDAHGVELSHIVVRQGQNGILLSNVSRSRVMDCDASFLSGWGLALWRSCDNIVARNAFDFCVRGYSHEVYSRGQDSAGILCIEQCSRNCFLFNSATHGGDGLFAFAGRQALGEIPSAASTPDPVADALGRGCNENLIAFNDFSDAAAHGVETTFSFRNRILFNRLERNAICGIWGGYSHDLWVRGNLIKSNGTVGLAEGGGINIEHGAQCRIEGNTFGTNAVGIALWWDADASLAALPWAKANGTASRDMVVASNAFADETVALRLRDTLRTAWVANTLERVALAVDADAVSAASLSTTLEVPPQPDDADLATLVASLERPEMPVARVGATVESMRTALAGRSAIIMGPYGPYDYTAPMAIRLPSPSNEHQWRLMGPRTITLVQASGGSADLRTDIDDAHRIASVTTEHPGQLSAYTMQLFWGKGPSESTTVSGTIFNASWRVEVFDLPEGAAASPPTHEVFDTAAKDARVVFVESLTLPFGSGGPASAKLVAVEEQRTRFGTDHFGVRATTEFELPPGIWSFETMSDDGIRVTLDDTVIIDRWTHHAPTRDQVDVSVQDARHARLVVEYFELTGHAHLEVRVNAKSAVR